MRALIVLAVFIGLGGFGATVLWLWDRSAQRRIGLTDTEARRLLQAAIRQLDQGLGDPMLRQSTDWETSSQELVNRYYGKRLDK